MASNRVRRSAVIVALLGMIALVPGTAVNAATGALTYSCALPVIGGKPFIMNADTNAPGTVYLGTTYTPRLTTTSLVPADMVALMTGQLKAASVDGTFASTVGTDGGKAVVAQKIAKKKIVPGRPLTLVATGVMSRIAPTAVGARTYRPGNITVTMNFYKANGSSAGSFANLLCTMPANSKIIDKVAFAKSPTKITPAVTYAKAARKVTAIATVTASSRAVPTGKVVADLYRGASKIKTVSATLAGGKATATYAGISAKGAYKVVFTYAGTSVLIGSSSSKAFAVR